MYSIEIVLVEIFVILLRCREQVNMDLRTNLKSSFQAARKEWRIGRRAERAPVQSYYAFLPFSAMWLNCTSKSFAINAGTFDQGLANRLWVEVIPATSRSG